MNFKGLIFLYVLFIAFTAYGVDTPADFNKVTVPTTAVPTAGLAENPIAKAAVIPCKGLIDDGLLHSIKRRTQAALDGGAKYLIYQIETYGGLVKSADEISDYLIIELDGKAKTIAYITTKAISAGALISVSCDDIIMRPNTTIGDCAPITMGESLEGVEREKAESFIRGIFERAAQNNGYPEALLKAMVSMKVEVWQVRNMQSGKYEFFEKDKLPSDSNIYDIKTAQKIDSDSEILTLTAAKALEYGIARTLANDINEVLAYYEQRDNVRFTGLPVIWDTNWSEELVRLLNHPVTTGLLFSIALLALYVEFSAPGVGLPGLTALICFAIIFGSRFLVGLAVWWEIALFVFGVLLLAAEIFLVPGFGITGVSGIFCMLVSLFAILVGNRPDELPWPKYEFEWSILGNGAVGLIAGFIVFVIAAALLTKYIPKISFLSGLILTPATQETVMQASMTGNGAAGNTAGGLKVGDKGIAIKPLRPAGKARFGAEVVDVVAQGEFIENNQPVQIVEIKGNRVVVKR